ncbi:hypothetical protein HID58_083899, partial [Brassica napus]
MRLNPPSSSLIQGSTVISKVSQKTWQVAYSLNQSVLKRSVDVFYNMVCVTLRMYLMCSSLRCYVRHISPYDHETLQATLCYRSMDIYAEPSLSREKKNLKGSVIIEESNQVKPLKEVREVMVKAYQK